MKAVECAETVLLNTAVCDAFEFQGSARTIVVVGHDGFVKGTGGPIWPTTNFVNTPKWREIPEALWCGMAE